MRLWPACWKAGCEPRPCGWIMSRPRNRKSRNPCWVRSGSAGKRDRSPRIEATVGRSSRAKPVQSVAQMTALEAWASRPRSLTASAEPSRPWPKMSGRAGRRALAARGTRQMSRASRVLPSRRTGRPRRSSAKREPVGQPGWSRKQGTVTVPSTRRATFASCSGVNSVTRVTRKGGAAPSTRRSLEVAIAELVERAVADGQHPRGERVPAGHGEVPRQVQLVALDARAAQVAEHALHVAPALADRARAAGQAVAEGAERAPSASGGRRPRRAAGAARRRSAGPRAS